MRSSDDKIILCSINIEKEDDEWFWCRVIRFVNSIPAAIYRADQIDGLINLLESISLDLEKVYNAYLIEKFNESSNQYYNNQKFAVVRDSVVLYDENGHLVNKYNLDQFTKSEVDEIDSIMLSRFRAKRYYNQWTPMSINYNYLENFRYFICKSEDEWYFLSVTNIQSHEWFYYRCDQYEGLIKLLNDLPESEMSKDERDRIKAEEKAKKIRRFNESNEYYQTIDSSDYSDLVQMTGRYKNTIRFEQKYVDEIERILKTDYRIIQLGNSIFISRYQSIYYEIIQCEDEWFYIRREVDSRSNESYNYYKCDQFEGLLKFLKDYNIIDMN
jgi:hypothetical protein